MAGRGKAGAGRNALRIIGGAWRSRRLRFPDVAGLRPTGDRQRETLFNWLAPHLPGARCLDLFAGSGALGLEALSRGAGEVVFVDNHRQALAQLEANLALLKAEGAEVVGADALSYLRGTPRPFDIVFLDPPFRQGLLEPACALLAVGWLASDARVYIELEREAGMPALPTGWVLRREKISGQVTSLLVAVA